MVLDIGNGVSFIFFGLNFFRFFVNIKDIISLVRDFIKFSFGKFYFCKGGAVVRDDSKYRCRCVTKSIV